MTRLFVIILFLLTTKNISAQSPYSLSKQYTIEDGLPSNECYAVIQDSLGYIWVATDRGLSRFDGYGFKNYGIADGLKELSCLQMQMDSHGNIWLRTYSNRIYKYLHETDKIEASEFNDRLLAEVDDSEIFDFRLASDTLFVAIIGKGYLKVDKVGKFHPYHSKYSYTYNSYLKVNDGVLCYSHYSNDSDLEKFIFDSGSSIEKTSFNLNDQCYDLRYRLNQKKLINPTAFKTPDNKILYCNTGHIYVCTPNKIEDIFEIEPIQVMIFLNNGSLLTGELEGEGIKYYQTLEDLKANLFETVYDDISVGSMLLDQDGNLIVSTLDEGVLLFKKAEIIPVKHPLIQGNEIINIQGVNTSNLILNIHQKDVLDYDFIRNEITRTENKKYEMLFQVFQNFNTGFRLYCAHPTSYLEFKNASLPLTRKPSLIDRIIAKKARSLPNNKTIVLTSVGIHIFKDFENSPTYETYPTINRLDAIDALDYRDGYLIGGRDGLYYLEDYVKTKLHSIHPFFNYRINSIQRIDSTYYLGSLGGGLAIWDGHDDVQIINEIDGLISNNIEQVVTDNFNTLAICTKYGMSKISLSGRITIDNFTVNHGLPSNQVNDALFINDTLIIGTSKGLAYMPPNALNIPNPPKLPIIESLSVNNKESTKVDSLNLDYDENAISINFKSLDYTQVNPIKYRYRLNSAPWTITTDTEVNFAALQPNRYQFQVSASNMDGEWSEPTELNFKISKPWWSTNLFLVLVGLVTGTIAYYIYKRRISAIEEKIMLEREIRNLERSALQAQMNPHFIFNCLNSIQSFIISNEKEMAMDYLSKFAKLIRLNLNASHSNNVSLDQEIKMLKNYIELEQLRCNHSFEYSITVPDHLDPISTLLPPLLIQPFVENAIIHGMKERTSGGLIDIKFGKVDSALHISIADNGHGMVKNPVNDKQSIGMKLTQKRLALINKMAPDNYRIDISTGEDGTTINLIVQLTH